MEPASQGPIDAETAASQLMWMTAAVSALAYVILCKCFRKCYTPCRNNDHQPPLVCNVKCSGKCIFQREVSAAWVATGPAGRSARPAARPPPLQLAAMVVTEGLLMLTWRLASMTAAVTMGG